MMYQSTRFLPCAVAVVAASWSSRLVSCFTLPKPSTAMRRSKPTSLRGNSISSWEKLQVESDSFTEERNGQVMFSFKELEKRNPTLAESIQETTSFDVPSTREEVLQTYFSQPSFQLVLFLATALVLLRLFLGPLHVQDLETSLVTWAFWHVKEWYIHAHMFHGHGHDKKRASSIFIHHDHHHLLPYFHVATEPFSLCVAWFAVAASVAGFVIDPILGDHGLTVTALLTYTIGGLGYISLHYLAHTKVPLDGWLQQARDRHMSHHISPSHNLNMGPNFMDDFMATTQPLREAMHRKKDRS